MQELTSRGRQEVADLAQRYGVSIDAVTTLLCAMVPSNGTMAQFQHPELGGSGQWMRGGMTMVGDMFNHALKARVNGLCVELSQLLAQQPFLAESTGGEESGRWWPAHFGAPAATGGQNQVRYAYFPSMRRLVVERNSRLSVYDTLDHQIGGVAQQQGGGRLAHVHQSTWADTPGELAETFRGRLPPEQPRPQAVSAFPGFRPPSLGKWKPPKGCTRGFSMSPWKGSPTVLSSGHPSSNPLRLIY